MLVKRAGFIAVCIAVVFMLSACGGDRSRIVGTWSGLVGDISMMAWRYEFNRDGTGTWGDARVAAAELVFDWDLGRYVNPWSDFNVEPITWSISGDILEIVFTNADTVNIYHFEFTDNNTLVLTREGWLTGFELTRLE